MSSRKRDREEENIQIKVAYGMSLAADSFVLRALSSCARALPADAAEWDVSGLLYDGQPFSRETVACWLQCGYSHIYAEDSQLEPESIAQLSTVTGLAQVLAFAQAVGSFKGLVRAACSQLQQLKFVVQLPQQEEGLELPLSGYIYYFGGVMDKQLVQYNLQDRVEIGPPLDSAEQRCDVQQQAAKQAAALLQLAHALRLQPLLDMLHQFILHNVLPGGVRLLCGTMGFIFTDAVLEAAIGSSTLSKEAYISSVLSHPCSLAPVEVGHTSLLKAIGTPVYHTSTKLLKFDAQLLRDFAKGKAGDTVKVELDLFRKGKIKLQPVAGSTFVILPAQLLLGYSLSDAADLGAF